MCEKRKIKSSCVAQAKNRRKTISIENKLDVISRLGKGDRIVDTCRVVGFAHGSARTIRNNADRVKQSAKSGTEVFV
jgi:low affinity Fe/Cu permease